MAAPQTARAAEAHQASQTAQRPEPATAYRVLLRMQVKPGQDDQFVRAWCSGAATIAAEAAQLGQSLSRSDTEPGVYYIVSDWTDEASFRDYERSDRHQEHRARLHPYRESGSMSTMTVVAVRPADATGPPAADGADR